MRSFLIVSVQLLMPVWGLALIVWLFSLSSNPATRSSAGGAILLLGAMLPFLGAAPIFQARASSSRTAGLIAYFFVCAVVMFFEGWVLLDTFKL